MPLVGLSDDELLDRVRVSERVRRQLAAADHRLIVELEVRSVASRLLLKGTAGLLSEVLKIDVAEARARVKGRGGVGAPDVDDRRRSAAGVAGDGGGAGPG